MDDDGKATRWAIFGGTVLACVMSLRNELRQTIDGSIEERYSQRQLADVSPKIRLVHGDAKALKALQAHAGHMASSDAVTDVKARRVGRFICQLERKLNALTDVRHYWHRLLSDTEEQCDSDSLILYARLTEKGELAWCSDDDDNDGKPSVAVTFGRVPAFVIERLMRKKQKNPADLPPFPFSQSSTPTTDHRSSSCHLPEHHPDSVQDHPNPRMMTLVAHHPPHPM